MAKQPESMPDGSWPITPADKEKIRAFGRELTKFITNYVAAEKSLHIKIVAGGFQYFMMLQDQKAKLIGDDLARSNTAIESLELGNLIEEPFAEPVILEPEVASIDPKDAAVDVEPMKTTEDDGVGVNPVETQEEVAVAEEVK